MNMKEIEVLMTIARSKSFYEAACALNYAPSVVSKCVSNVEEELGVVLFVRSNRASSIALTKEGSILMPHFLRLHECGQQLRSDAAVLQGGNNSLLKIGTGNQLISLGMDEIMAHFYQAHPEVRIEQTRMDFESQIHSMYSGQQDGVFLLVQNGSSNSNSLNSLLEDSKVESFLLVREHNIYLGISEDHPLANKDSTPLAAFREFSIAFHSDKAILVKAGTMAPFLRLSKKAGFELTPIYIDPRDTSAFYLATQMKIAIPSLRCSVKYPGVKFVRVEDSTSYFLTLKANRNSALAQFKKSVQVFLSQGCENQST